MALSIILFLLAVAFSVIGVFTESFILLFFAAVIVVILAIVLTALLFDAIYSKQRKSYMEQAKRKADSNGAKFFCVGCARKVLAVYEDRVLLGTFCGERTIYYRNCVSVHVTAESIGFETTSADIPLDNTFFWSYTDKSSMVTSEYMSDVIKFIKSKVAECKQLSSANSVTDSESNADELKKYKDLLDQGVITQEEFDAKKKQLLGL